MFLKFFKAGIDRTDPRKDKSLIMALRRPQDNEGISKRFTIPFSENMDLTPYEILALSKENKNIASNTHVIPGIHNNMSIFTNKKIMRDNVEMNEFDALKIDK